MPGQPPAQTVYVESTEKNGLGTSSFVLGILGTVFGLVPIAFFFALPLSIIGLGLGLGNIGRLRKHKATNKVMTGLGIGLSVLGVVLSIIGIVIVNRAIKNA
jgi:hypothetical protein